MRHAAGLRAVTFALASGAGLLAVLLAAPLARTQSTDAQLAERLNGRWSLATGESDARRMVDRAIDRTTSGMLPIVRGFAERELRARNPVGGDVTISIAPDRIRTAFVGATYDSAPGHPITTRVPGESEDLEVVQLLREGRLEQVFTTDRGRRWSVFVPSQDGEHLTMQVVVQADLLPRELRYQLAYDRAR